MICKGVKMKKVYFVLSAFLLLAIVASLVFAIKPVSAESQDDCTAADRALCLNEYNNCILFNVDPQICAAEYWTCLENCGCPIWAPPAPPTG